MTRPSYLPPFREKADKFELSIAKLTKSDEGDYTCIVSNVLGSLNQTFTVEAMDSINHRPILIDQSRNQTVMEGMDVELFCRYSVIVKSSLTVNVLRQCSSGDQVQV